MSNKKQTPVEQFAEQLASKNLLGIYTYDEMVMFEDLLKHSKEMEKQRMIEFAQSYAVIHCMGDITKNAEQYYKETYENEQ